MRRAGGMAGLAAVALALLAPSSAAPGVPAPGKRISIAVVGDSVVEGYTLPGALRDSLVPQLTDELVRRGYARGGVGLIPANPYRWSVTRPTLPSEGAVPAGGWRVYGPQGPVHDGPSGYSLVATTPGARATTAVHGPELTLLYTTNVSPTPFSVTGGGRSWALDARAPGARHAAETTLTLAPGTREITVHGPRRGTLILDGAVDHRNVPAGRIQVEVSNLGHAGLQPADTLRPRVLAAFARRHYDVTIFLWSYVSEAIVTGKKFEGDFARRYELGLLPRARLARRSGRCLISDKGPLDVAPATTRKFSAIHARVARLAHCGHTSALANLWQHPETGFEQGYTQVDDLHPTRRGYRLIVRALGPRVAALVKAAAASKR